MHTCTDQILAGLGQMYAAGGKGTADFASKAIREYLRGGEEEN